MAKPRKTKKEKIRSAHRHTKAQGFVLKDEWMVTKDKQENIKPMDGPNRSYFWLDLTKTLILTMLVLALELALWQYLSRH